MDTGTVKPKSGMGQSVSIMSRPAEDMVEDSKKTVFDWCIEGNVTQVTQILTNDKACVNQKDDNVSPNAMHSTEVVNAL